MNQFARSGGALVSQLKTLGVTNDSVLNAMSEVPRHFFIESVLAHKAYENTALPIGQGQTISQPYIVGKMTQLLVEHNVETNVLEIGTGSGYQAAILGKVFDKVFSVERIRNLQLNAKRKLQQLDIYNVQMKHGDGWQGWESKAPFDAIIVTAAPNEVPPALKQQLKDGGILILPVGERVQHLVKIVRNGDTFVETILEPAKFVPLVAGATI
ncbi:protein-L-isoaspartate(D-aspartate) O-methyltransferase [Psychrosphaera sp. B3R10]|uniref:Protein-L-isoaspartate O-methyltransferase n=1 Tax=Psychrosphaera algicola TaxID=3023714 RepID=A0ABT5FDP3_9GAMM|nr:MULTISPECIES: protein-L-isoaspartate(D-aspartate) O-methyltransferase [unclassified Psychrosphaera]MBU2881059.1 protein-L-isoaspartate(D-aspartate) O-methyltransferase [Psychrosphaera sp. I2R16]MBU2989983.1 protein-L-isoaspartate(D-aspartate) O-methyltransferase [Psychrosphaera sp. B3R10]MDC2889052.1 protein-L-isoaspartate(D-aspartate) O-methyltransferase [Psychrosphaera sp. G1-22]MDO6719125.1 protein-L-isoaspartate(D-aspartate) O-methyltransferase [Psychrosphaera sp. 1_MG-2023]